MAYSDYGSFAFSRKKGGTWKRDKTLEDKTLLGGREDDRTLQKVYGLKLDVIIHSKKAIEGQFMLSDAQKWNWYQAHHAILGQYDSMAVLCYKKPVTVLWKGEEICKTTWETTSPVSVEKEGWKVFIQTCEEYSFALLTSPAGDQSAAFTNCGLGDGHWWQDDEGYTESGRHYPREDHFLSLLSSISSEDGELVCAHDGRDA